MTDRYGRKRCFLAGLTVYGVGALLCALAPGLGVLILGNSILEGVGTAVAGTILVSGLTTRAYGAAMVTLAVLGLGGLAAAALLPRGRVQGGAEPGTRCARARPAAHVDGVRRSHRKVCTRASLKAVCRWSVAPAWPPPMCSWKNTG